MTDGQPPVPSPENQPQPQPQSPVPSPSGFMFAAVFGLAMLFNLYWDATHADYSNPTVTIFLGSCTLLILGVDVGRIIGRR